MYSPIMAETNTCTYKMSILPSLRWVKLRKKNFACILCRSKLVNNISPKAIYLGVTSNNAPSIKQY